MQHRHFKTALKEYEKALTYYEKALEQNPFNTTALNNMGFQLNQLGRYDEAISYFDELIEYEPDFLFAWSNRALAKIKSGKTTDGMHDIKVALSIDDSHAYTYRVLGIYHLDRNENDEALKHFKKAQVLDAAVDDIDMLIRMAQLKNML